MSKPNQAHLIFCHWRHWLDRLLGAGLPPWQVSLFRSEPQRFVSVKCAVPDDIEKVHKLDLLEEAPPSI